MKTTRQDFGTTLTLLARLYKTAESRGDLERAQLYAIAVNALLDAWPSDDESAAFERQHNARDGWPAREKTLSGLGATRGSSGPRIAA